MKELNTSALGLILAALAILFIMPYVMLRNHINGSVIK